jgi:hypothetical protein
MIMGACMFVCACEMGLGSESAHGRADVGVRMRNGVGKRERPWTHVRLCAHAEWGRKARVLMIMDACLFVCACEMGLGSESAHGRMYVCVRMRNGVGKRERPWTHVCLCALAEWDWDAMVYLALTQ